jgi:hypothetical protein
MRLIMLVCATLLSISVSFSGNQPSTNASENNTTPAKVKVFSGWPIFIDGVNNVIILQNDKNKRKEFTLADTARIIKDGNQIEITTLTKKSRCVATYQKKKGKLICLRIEQVSTGKWWN